MGEVPAKKETTSEKQHADTYDDRSGDHVRSSTTPFRAAAICDDADYRLHDEAREGSCHPDEGDSRFGETETEEVGSAVRHFDAPCYPINAGVSFSFSARNSPGSRHCRTREIRRSTYCIPIKLAVSRAILMASEEPLMDEVPFQSHPAPEELFPPPEIMAPNYSLQGRLGIVGKLAMLRSKGQLG
jgi:hypothetical protein